MLSFGTIVWGAGADASAGVCSEFRAAAWAYLNRAISDIQTKVIEKRSLTMPWTICVLFNGKFVLVRRGSG